MSNENGVMVPVESIRWQTWRIFTPLFQQLRKQQQQREEMLPMHL
jgi:hypothetical protein